MLTAIPELLPVDADRLARYDEGVRARATLEILIVRHLVEHLIKQGLYLSVWDGEDYSIHKASSVEAVMDEVMAGDVDVISAFKRCDGTWQQVGQIVLVYGNDGWDVISDNTLAMEPYLVETTAFAEQLCELSCG